MKATVSYNNNVYIEQDVDNIKMTDFTCECGNQMYVPQGAVELGLTATCGHCNNEYPKEHHCASITEGWKGLVEDGNICLD